MKIVSTQEAQTNLAGLMAETSLSHEPIRIAGEREQAVLLADEDWRAVQETLYLLAIPGMRESIRAGLTTPLSECAEELAW